MAKNLKELIKVYTSVYYMEDTSLIPLVCGVVLSNRLSGDPIWLMIVGGSSSGKTEIINAITGLDFVHQMDTLTPNTLLSGSKSKDPKKQTSFLLRIPRTSVIVMRDFTTLLSMSREDQQEIMAQFRQVFDGHFSKDTGHGDHIEWNGKINLIAGVTEKLYAMEAKFSGMGTRAINYVLPTQDRIKTTKRSSQIAGGIKEYREMIKKEFTEYLNIMLEKISVEKSDISEETSDKIVLISCFASLARSPVEHDYMGKIDLVLSPEMPMRMSNQLHLLASVFIKMEDGQLTEKNENIIYKIAFDSIPKGRRIVLKVLAAYDMANTKGIAMELNYPTERIRSWLEELNVLGIVDRMQGTSNKGDNWSIKKEYRDLVMKFDSVEKKADKLEAKEEEEEIEADDDVFKDFMNV